jgi:hypothetical protein
LANPLLYKELALGDNCVRADLDKKKITFLNHSLINFVATRDDRFSNHLFKTLGNLMRKSTQISATGEKDRDLFFSAMREKIHHKKRAILKLA